MQLSVSVIIWSAIAAIESSARPSESDVVLGPENMLVQFSHFSPLSVSQR